jgi:RNA-directed DNA polymerase
MLAAGNGERTLAPGCARSISAGGHEHRGAKPLQALSSPTNLAARANQWNTCGAYLLRFAWTNIVRHQMVRGTASPDDPALTEYRAARRHRGIPRVMDPASLRLLQSQHGHCPWCGELLLDADRPPQTPREWEQWLTVTRKAMTKNAVVLPADGAPDETRLRLLHAHCYRQFAGKRKSPALQPVSAPPGLA